MCMYKMSIGGLTLTLILFRILPRIFQHDVCVSVGARENTDHNASVRYGDLKVTAQPGSELTAGIHG